MTIPVRRWFVLLVTVFMTGCSSIGPQQINMDRGRYNDIVRETDQEQILENIVRLRYVETPSYLQVSNVTASYSRSSAVSGTNVAISGSNNAVPTNWSWANLGFTPSVTYSDSPTISYVPITNTKFVESLQKPVSFTNFVLLSRGAVYNHGLLLTLLLERVDDLDNSAVATTKGIIDAPNYQQYYRFVDLFQTMLNKKAIHIEPIEFEEKLGLMLQFRNSHSPDALQLKKMLHVPLNSQYIGFIDKGEYSIAQNKAGMLTLANTDSMPRNVVYVQLRSINAIMSFLSHGVQVPEQDLKAHVTMEIIHPDGSLYNWDPIMKDIMTIYSSDKEPQQDVFIKTKVNNHWFYIKASDLDSKMTFALLIRLITLAAGAPSLEDVGPALTLPVS